MLSEILAEHDSREFAAPTEEQLTVRAREIAVTNGRLPGQVNAADFEQARQELSSLLQSLPSTERLETEAKSGVDSASQRTKNSAPSTASRDEQSLAESLTQEVLEKAVHERLVEGNRESRRRDQSYEDQVPEL